MTKNTSPEALMGMRAYLATRFYPPLPAGYAPLALRAVERVSAGDTTRVRVPASLNPQPRAVRSGLIDPVDLVDALRLWHAVDLDDEEVA